MTMKLSTLLAVATALIYEGDTPPEISRAVFARYIYGMGLMTKANYLANAERLRPYLQRVQKASMADSTYVPGVRLMRSLLTTDAEKASELAREAIVEASALPWVDKERAWQVMQLSATLAASKALTKWANRTVSNV